MLLELLPIRVDTWGDGHFATPRGNKTHLGVDFACYPGTTITSQTAGHVSKLGVCYPDDPSYRYVEVQDVRGYHHRYFYVDPAVSIGDEIKRGQGLGVSQDISARYPAKGKKKAMVNHCHYEILNQVRDKRNPINPMTYHRWEE